MRTKKTKTANLERKRIIFFEYGILLALSLCLLAFEWGNEDSTDFTSHVLHGESFDEEPPPQTVYRPPLPPPPPIMIPDFDIVEPEVEIEETDIIFTAEIDPWEGLELFTIPEEEEKPEEIIVCPVPDSEAEFGDGSVKNFQTYVYNNLVYSEQAINLGLEGRVIVRFIIDENGRLVNPEIMRGIDPLLDDEVLRVIKNSPRWKPAIFNKRKVKVSYVIPVIFKLQ